MHRPYKDILHKNKSRTRAYDVCVFMIYVVSDYNVRDCFVTGIVIAQLFIKRPIKQEDIDNLEIGQDGFLPDDYVPKAALELVCLL